VIHMLVGVIDPAGAGSEPDGPLMRALRFLSPVRHAINALCHAELKDCPLGKTKGFLSKIKEGPSMGALAGVTSGNDVLDKLGILGSFYEPVKNIAFLAVLHLTGSAVALILASPRFAKVKPAHDKSETSSKRAIISPPRVNRIPAMKLD